MKVGREQEARHVLQATRDGDVEHELRGIKKVVKFELETSSTNHYWAMLFPKDKYARQLRWRVVLAVWLQIMQELVGIGVITVYAVDLFQDAGFGKELSKLLAGFNNLSYMFSVIFAVITLDRYGRRCKQKTVHVHLPTFTDSAQLRWSGGLSGWPSFSSLLEFSTNSRVPLARINEPMGPGWRLWSSSTLRLLARLGSQHPGFTPQKSSHSMYELREEPGQSSAGPLATASLR